MREKNREQYMLCCDCGYAVKRKFMFEKAYKHTGMCLCRKCALKLAKEITEHYEVQQCEETTEK